MQCLLSFSGSSTLVCMFCTMNINDCYTANTPGEYSLREGMGKNMCTALSSLFICENKIDLWGLGKWLFLTLGYANLTLVCVYCFTLLLCALFTEAFPQCGTDLTSKTVCREEMGKKEPCEFNKWVYQFGNQCWNRRFTFPLRQIQWYSIKSNTNAMHLKYGRHTNKWWVCLLVCKLERRRKRIQTVQTPERAFSQTHKYEDAHSLTKNTNWNIHSH